MIEPGPFEATPCPIDCTQGRQTVKAHFVWAHADGRTIFLMKCTEFAGARALVVFECKSPFCQGKGLRAWDSRQGAEQEGLADIMDQKSNDDRDSNSDGQRHLDAGTVLEELMARIIEN